MSVLRGMISYKYPLTPIKKEVSLQSRRFFFLTKVYIDRGRHHENIRKLGED